MTATEIIQTNSYGDTLTWWHSSKLAENLDPEADNDNEGTQECATCEAPVDLDGQHWHCIDNAEVRHETCALPDW